MHSYVGLFLFDCSNPFVSTGEDRPMINPSHGYSGLYEKAFLH